MIKSSSSFKKSLVASVHTKLLEQYSGDLVLKGHILRKKDSEKIIDFDFEIKTIKKEQSYILIEPYVQVFLNKCQPILDDLAQKVEIPDIFRAILSQSIGYFSEKESYKSWEVHPNSSIEEITDEIADLISGILKYEFQNAEATDYYFEAYKKQFKKFSYRSNFLLNLSICLYLDGNTKAALEICTQAVQKANTEIIKKVFEELLTAIKKPQSRVQP